MEVKIKKIMAIIMWWLYLPKVKKQIKQQKNKMENRDPLKESLEDMEKNRIESIS